MLQATRISLSSLIRALGTTGVSLPLHPPIHLIFLLLGSLHHPALAISPIPGSIWAAEAFGSGHKGRQAVRIGFGEWQYRVDPESWIADGEGFRIGGVWIVVCAGAE